MSHMASLIYLRWNFINVIFPYWESVHQKEASKQLYDMVCISFTEYMYI